MASGVVKIIKKNTHFVHVSQLIFLDKRKICSDLFCCIQDLPEFFEDNMATWMGHFHTLLTTDNKLLQTQVQDQNYYIIILNKWSNINTSLINNKLPNQVYNHSYNRYQ